METGTCTTNDKGHKYVGISFVEGGTGQPLYNRKQEHIIGGVIKSCISKMLNVQESQKTWLP